jgi:hypothetical protein
VPETVVVDLAGEHRLIGHDFLTYHNGSRPKADRDVQPYVMPVPAFSIQALAGRINAIDHAEAQCQRAPVEDRHV